MADSVVIVTGGGRGIGRAIAERFAVSGAQIVAAARSRKDLDETKAIIERAGGRCDVQPTDVCVEDEIDSLIETTVSRFGRIDVLVNNAGVAPICALEELDPSVFGTLTSVNMHAVFYACRAVWPIMKKQGRGTIINMSSISAMDPFPGFTAYGASKAWVSAWTRGLADEGAQVGIRVFAVGPGAVETKMLRDVFPDFPAEQAIQPAHVAAVAYQLAQPDCRYVNGQTIFVKK